MAVLCGNIPTQLIKDEDSELQQITAEFTKPWGVINRAFE